MWQDDPLRVWNPRRACFICKDWSNEQRKSTRCKTCDGTRYMPMDLAGHWAPSPGFLVCGGASLREFPIERLRERGVMSLGINNAAAYAPCSAFTFGDGQWKFHSSLYADGKCIAFVPVGKLGKRCRVKTDEGFRFLDERVGNFPNVYGYARRPTFCAENFLTDWWAQWGWSNDIKRRQFDCWDGDNIPYTMITSALLGLRLLHYLGCPRVYLLGLDHWNTDELPYAWKGNRTRGNGRWWKEDKYFKDIRPYLEASGFHVYNVNPASKVEAFDHVQWDVAIRDCKQWIGDEPFDLNGDDWYSKTRRIADQKLFACPDCHDWTRRQRRRNHCDTCGNAGEILLPAWRNLR